MPGKCFVTGCQFGLDSIRKQYKKENRKHPQIFSAPKNWTMLQIWSHVIPASAEKFSITDKICETHFTDDSVVKYDILPFDDGKKIKVERRYGALKPGAIPTIFPLHQQYSKNIQKIVDKMRKEFPLHIIPRMEVRIDEHMENYFKRILELKKLLISDSKETLYESEKNNSDENTNVSFENMVTNETNFSDDESDTEGRNICDVNLDTKDRNMYDVDSDTCDREDNVSTGSANSECGDIEIKEDNVPDEITFDVLVRNINSVSRPNSSWSITAHGKFVMCAKWNKEYIPEKRVVIDRDLNIKVFLNDSEIAAYNNCISDISDISNILCILDK